MKKCLLLTLCALRTASAWSDFTPLAYNQPELEVDLGVGLWAWPMPMDWDADGDYDLVVSCPDKPYNGTYFFENPGNGKAFKPAVKVGKGLRNAQVSYVDGQPRVLVPNSEFVDFLGKQFDTAKQIHPKITLSKGRERAKQWKYLDYDGDGVLDLSVGIGSWFDYGWDDAYDENGTWTNGPLRGSVYIIRNAGSTEKPKYEKPHKLDLEVYGMPSPNFADFDDDGDLDLICGEFLDGFTYFQNTGTRTKPVYAKGQYLEVYMDLQMITPVVIDWDKDGDHDLICGDEDGRVAFIENTGNLDDGIPQFKQPVYLKQQAEHVKFGALVTPVSVDWDGDGDEDLVCGNTAGYIGFIENLGGGKKWAEAVRLKADGEVIRLLAGPNGSIQGPCEAKWGYTTIAVADWDHDGDPDIVANSIWGKVVWWENRGKGQLAAEQPLRFNGTIAKPEWNWWDPKPGEFVTQWRTTPVVIDWNKDGRNDLIMMDHEGFLALFPRNKNGGLDAGQRIFGDGNKLLNIAGGRAGKSGRRKFCFTDWDNDGDLDLLMNSMNISLFRNHGKKNGLTHFVDEGPISVHRLAGHTTSPTMIDLNGDGKKELLVGAEDGFLYRFTGKWKPSKTIKHGSLSISGWGFELAELKNQGKAYTNRDYVVENLPADFTKDWQYTRGGGGEAASISVSSAVATTIYIATSEAIGGASGNWIATEGQHFNYTDKNKSKLKIYSQSVDAGQLIQIPQGSWTGGWLLLPPPTQEKKSPEISSGEHGRPNVLFIAVDDLRAEIACYGDEHIISPNLDALAQRSTLFERTYCQQAVCNPSRASLLTGLRPDTLGIWNLATHFREKRPDVVTLPQLFKLHGYATHGVGKIFHNWRQKIHGDPASWSVPQFMHYNSHGNDKALVRGPLPPDLSGVPRTEMRDVPDDAYFDGRIANEAIRRLQQLKDASFFLAVGFWKPHAHFNAPKKYWDFYDRDDIELAANPHKPKNVPEIALHDSREIMRAYKGKKPTTEQARAMRHGYFAAISYMDAQIGKVLDELKRLDLEKETIVVFWSDHGFHLGEHALWAKTSNFELDARVPMMIALPGQTNPQRVRGLTELLDLYPTLAELCELPAPKALEGDSLVPSLKNPNADTKPAAFTWHPRPAYPDDQKGPDAMGYSMRSDRHRYTEWIKHGTDEVIARELYDHLVDPDETENITGDKPYLTKALSEKLTRHRNRHEKKEVRVPAETAPPNLVCILIDDLGWMDVGYNGSRLCETPNLDRLAKQGMRFDRAYAAAPICSASRAALLTGKSPARLRFEFVTKNSTQNRPGIKNTPLLPFPYTHNLALDEITIPEMLKPAGYTSAFFGKWHVNAHHERYLGWSPTHGPKAQGFDIAEEDFGGHPYNKSTQQQPGAYPLGTYPPDSMTDHAIAFLKQRKGDAPFYLQVNHFYVHTPVKNQASWLTEKYAAKLKPGEPRRWAEYAAFVDIMDHQVGRLLEAIPEDTVVVLTSDNGGDPQYTQHAPLQGHKWTLYEGGIRVPMIVRAPGMTKAGSSNTTPVIGMDIMPTFAELAELPAPQNIDGQSLVPLIKGEALPPRDLTWHFPWYHHEKRSPGDDFPVGINNPKSPFLSPHAAILRGDEKLIHYFEPGRSNAYFTVTGREAEVIQPVPKNDALEQKLLQQLHAQGARIPVSSQAPNILLFFLDDVGRELLGCYGGASYQTPRIDQLAREGLRFEHCYATPMCVPSRVEVLTGKYSFRNYDTWFELKPSEETIGQRLRDLGYATALAGKWQFGGWEHMPQPHIVHAGFDEYFSYDSVELAKSAKLSKGNRLWGGEMITNFGYQELKGYGMDERSDWLINFMQRHREQPFFAMYSMTSMHRPIQPTPDYPDAPAVGEAAPADWMAYRGKPEYFAGQLAYTDKTIGKVLDALDTLNLSENTLVIFTSDNGTDNHGECKTLTSEYRGRALRGGKYFPTELGVNVPFIARWPGTISAGTTSDALIDLTDVFPTLLDVAHQRHGGHSRDGQSLVSLFTDPAAVGKPLIYSWGNYENNSSKYKAPAQYPDKLLDVVRNERWKLYSDGRLFDLTNDYFEEAPVTHPEAMAVRTKLEAQMKALRESTPRIW